MTGFNFIDGQPHDSVFTDIQTLNKFDLQQFSELVGILFHFLSDPSKNEWLLEQIDEFSKTHGVNATGLRAIIKSLLTVPNGALKKNLSTSQISEDLVSLGLSQDRVGVFIKKWSENLPMMLKVVQSQTLTVNHLVDMDWKFGVTVASSEVNKVGNTFLQLKLVINNEENKQDNVFMELSLPQFYSFLHEMEKAKASLEYLS